MGVHFNHIRIPLIILTVLLFFGCNESFQPFQENDQYDFSIYGFLDASADTQWIRVAPERQEFNMPPEVSGVRVTLEDLETGTSTVMNDSIFTSEGEFNFLNVWTTMDIEPNQSYRLIAEGSDGEMSQVTVTTPTELPTPFVLKDYTSGSPIPPDYYIYIDDSVEHLIDVQTRWFVRFHAPGFEEKKIFSFSYRKDAELTPAYGGKYRIFVEPDVEQEEIEVQNRALLNSGTVMEVVYRQIYVASGGPEWNENIGSLNDFVYALPNGFSNVENGLGYLVGVSSKIIPYGSCYSEEGLLISCEEEKPYW